MYWSLLLQMYIYIYYRVPRWYVRVSTLVAVRTCKRVRGVEHAAAQGDDDARGRLPGGRRRS